MHAILHLQTNWAVAKDDQALKQRLGETSSGCLLVHDNGAELLMIANEHDLLTAKHQRYHALCERKSARRKGRCTVIAYQVQQLVSLRQSRLS